MYERARARENEREREEREGGREKTRQRDLLNNRRVTARLPTRKERVRRDGVKAKADIAHKRKRERERKSEKRKGESSGPASSLCVCVCVCLCGECEREEIARSQSSFSSPSQIIGSPDKTGARRPSYELVLRQYFTSATFGQWCEQFRWRGLWWWWWWWWWQQRQWQCG